MVRQWACLTSLTPEKAPDVLLLLLLLLLLCTAVCTRHHTRTRYNSSSTGMLVYIEYTTVTAVPLV